MKIDRPTPETDAAQHEGLLRTNPIPMQVVTAEFARRLERERDEARELLASEKITRDHVIKRGIEMQKERDEAREALMKIEDLFIDGTDIYADRETMGQIARNALEDAK
jgi:hypothetical protein